MNQESCDFSRGRFKEDDKNVPQTAGDMLTFLGYGVELAAEGAEAVRLYKEAFQSECPLIS